MAFTKGSGGLKKPKFGGARKTSNRPPDKKVLESLGGARVKAPLFDPRTSGNTEKGFIQNTPKKATGAMMGRAMPKMGAAKTSTRKDSRKQFKPKAGRKVF